MIEGLRHVIHEIEHTWASKRLLVVGDVMLDRYIHGEATRISPEAPVPVVRATYQTEQPGGAGNVAMNLARLGAFTQVIGFAGGDEDQRLLEESLRSNGISVRFVVSDGFPTISKLRVLGGHQQLLRLDRERLDVRPPEDYEQLIDAVHANLPDCDALVLSDYAKGALTADVCQRVIEAACLLGIPILVDPKSADFSRYRNATTICPNLGELSVATRADAHDLKGVLDAAESMLPSLGVDFITATLSEKGIALIRPNSRFIAPARARQVFDVSGAGDTVIAVLAMCLASGLERETAVKLANIAAGIVVGKVGTVPVEKHELIAALSPEIAFHAEEKMVSSEELLERVANWRANGERVVLTNGCFDLLHVGHITLLEQAHHFGDRLIVAINSDRSVQELKGPTRPIVGEVERARVLAALGVVDAVVIFDDPTPLRLILSVRPDVLVKGGDYVVDTVVGSQEVLSWGGQVKLVPTVEGFSTSRLIAKGKGADSFAQKNRT